MERYREVVEAYFRALEKRAREGQSLDRIASVASFFVSRVDTKVDKALDAMNGERAARARAERGQAAIANAKLAFAAFRELFAGARWEALAAKGARPQRVLWASTSTKDPAYPDLYYADALVGPDTIDTMTKETFAAYRDHGDPEARVSRGVEEARAHVAALAALGVDLRRVTSELEDEGVASFAASYDKAVASIGEKRRRFRATG